MRRLYEGDGKSDYNSLQANLNKRFSDGLTMLGVLHLVQDPHERGITVR